MITKEDLLKLKFVLRDFIVRQILENELDQETLTDYLNLLVMSDDMLIRSDERSLHVTQDMFEDQNLLVQTFFMIRNNYS